MNMTMILSNIIAADKTFRVTPPLRKLSKKPGPTCSPIINTKRINPKSCMKDRIFVGAVKPMCPAAIPANSTKVTPKDIPPILILPRKTPTAMTIAYNRVMWATESVVVKRLISHSMDLILYYILMYLKDV